MLNQVVLVGRIKEFKEDNQIVIGVKGRLETRDNQMIIINHKTTFLTSKKAGDSDE